MLSRNKPVRKCSTCQYWSLEHSEDGIFSDLGECRRYPPSQLSKIRVITRHDNERYLTSVDSYDEAMEQARSMWEERRELRLRDARLRLENIQEKIKTCAKASVEHWQREAEKQIQKIEEISSDTYTEKEHFFR